MENGKVKIAWDGMDLIIKTEKGLIVLIKHTSVTNFILHRSDIAACHSVPLSLEHTIQPFSYVQCTIVIFCC